MPNNNSEMLESAKITTYGLLGFLYLITIGGLLFVWFGPSDRQSSVIVRDIVGPPLLLIVGFLTGSQMKNNKTPPNAQAETVETMNVGSDPTAKPSGTDGAG